MNGTLFDDSTGPERPGAPLAARMRQALINENPDLAGNNPRYVLRITGDDEEAWSLNRRVEIVYGQ